MAQILVPLDGSDLADRAIPLAVALARAGNYQLSLIRTVDIPATDQPSPVVELEEAVKEMLEVAAAKIRDQYGIATTTFTSFGYPADAILHRAAEIQAAAVVMSTHGRSGLGRAVFGSVAEHVVRSAPIPVYLLPAAAAAPSETWRPSRVLVPLDGSDLSYSVMSQVPELAHEFKMEVVLMRAYEVPNPTIVRQAEMDQAFQQIDYEAEGYFLPILASLRKQGIEARSESVLGDPAKEIVSTAKRVDANMIAIATHGRSGLDRMRHGSVAEAVLRHSHLPLMTFGLQALKRLSRGVERAEDRTVAGVL